MAALAGPALVPESEFKDQLERRRDRRRRKAQRYFVYTVLRPTVVAEVAAQQRAEERLLRAYDGWSPADGPAPHLLDLDELPS